MSEKLFSAIAKCGVCKAELNRAENVPESQKSRVEIGAPMIAICDTSYHNTFSDLNLKVEIEWIEQSGLIK